MNYSRISLWLLWERNKCLVFAFLILFILFCPFVCKVHRSKLASNSFLRGFVFSSWDSFTEHALVTWKLTLKRSLENTHLNFFEDNFNSERDSIRGRKFFHNRQNVDKIDNDFQTILNCQLQTSFTCKHFWNIEKIFKAHLKPFNTLYWRILPMMSCWRLIKFCSSCHQTHESSGHVGHQQLPTVFEEIRRWFIIKFNLFSFFNLFGGLFFMWKSKIFIWTLGIWGDLKKSPWEGIL